MHPPRLPKCPQKRQEVRHVWGTCQRRPRYLIRTRGREPEARATQRMTSPGLIRPEPRPKSSSRECSHHHYLHQAKTRYKSLDIQSYLPKSQLDLALFVPGRQAIEFNLLPLLFDQPPESFSLCTVAYFTRELQQSSFKVYDWEPTLLCNIKYLAKFQLKLWWVKTLTVPRDIHQWCAW